MIPGEEDSPAHDKLAAEKQSKTALRVFTINDVNANVVGARHTNGGGAYLSDGDIKILKIEGMSSTGPAGLDMSSAGLAGLDLSSAGPAGSRAPR